MDKTSFSLASLAIAAICLLPILGVIAAALLGTTETLLQLADTVLWRYTWTTLVLVILVATGSIVIGASTAWLVVTCEFTGRRLLEIALVLPLAFPAYVLAYAYTDVLDHPGIVQSSLRALMGWGPRDYWFPEIRSLGGAAAMLTLVLYPYVYLMARTAFRLQAATPFYAARSLGASPFHAFVSVSLPMARPAIAGGMLLVVMETIADFGTVAHFSVQTFATGIYTSWFGLADRAAAAQLALGLLSFALLIAALESRLGYAVPGGVIAVGLLVPFATFDNWLDARMEDWFDISTGLLISGSIWLMIAAYMIRFLAAAISAYDSGLSTITPNIDAASRILGRSAWGTVRSVHLPVLRGSVLTALLIVFVDTIKELPATLILRPFNYDTLAVQAFRLASDERLEGAAVPSLMIAAIGLVPVILLCLQLADRRQPAPAKAA